VNFTVSIVNVWRGEYREEMILPVIMFIVKFCFLAIYRETVSECYCVFMRVCMGEYTEELIMHFTVFVVNF
jgi:hypothetical protein